MVGFQYQELESLAERVAAGEAVFFVGAGFSLDSEPNSSSRLISRLVARFEALTRLPQSLAALPAAMAQTMRELTNSLTITFQLKSKRGAERLLTKENITALAREYYQINDWMCSAYEELLNDIGEWLTRQGTE